LAAGADRRAVREIERHKTASERVLIAALKPWQEDLAVRLPTADSRSREADHLSARTALTLRVGLPRKSPPGFVVFTLRCTRILLKRLKAQPGVVAFPPSTRLGDWYAHLLLVRPAQLVLAVLW
jgi:Domain of unknown function (DUF6933)